MVSFLLLNGGALLVAFVLAGAPALRGQTRGLLLRMLCGYLVIVHSITLLAGLAGHLTVGGVAIPLTAAMIAALGVAHRMRDEVARTMSDEGDRRAERGTCFTAAALFAPLAAVASAIVWVWPHVFGA